MLVAVSVTPGGVAKICGALYIPEESTLPHAVPAHPAPEIVQITPRFGLPSEFTVAMRSREVPNGTAIDCGATITEMSLASVTRETELAPESAALVACTEMEESAGRISGAV